MVPALLDEQRRSLQRLSFAICAFAIATLTVMTPVSFVASAREAPASPAGIPMRVSKLDYPTVDLKRDPFVPSDAYRTIAPGAIARNGTGSYVVRAVITGPVPRALVESNGSVQVVGVGDRIGSLAVVGIDASGVVMEGGVTLPLVRAEP